MASKMFKTMAVAGAAILAVVSGGIAIGQTPVVGGLVEGQASDITARALAALIVPAAEAAATQAAASVDRDVIAQAAAVEAAQAGLTGEAAVAFVAAAVNNAVGAAVTAAIQIAIAATISSSGASNIVAFNAVVFANATLRNSTVISNIGPSARNAMLAATQSVAEAISTATSLTQTPATTQTRTATTPPPVVVVVYRA